LGLIRPFSPHSNLHQSPHQRDKIHKARRCAKGHKSEICFPRPCSPQLTESIGFPQTKKSETRRQGRDGETANRSMSSSPSVTQGKDSSKEKMLRLFSRFKQATKKTHIKYGGSGLGLQRIWVARLGLSRNLERAVPLPFNYIKVRRTVTPEDHAQILQPPRSLSKSRRQSTARGMVDRAPQHPQTAEAGPPPRRLLLVRKTM